MSRRVASALVALPLVLGLAACAPSPAVTPSTGVAASQAPSTTAAASPSVQLTAGPSAAQSGAAASPSLPPTSASPTAKPKVVDVLAAPMARGTVSPKVRELQARLRALKSWAYLDVTDSFGETTEFGVKLYQQRHNLPVTGVVDQAMWDGLINQTDKPSAEELANTNVGRPYIINEVPGLVREAQHRLKQLGLYAGEVDGVVGATTTAALSEFQKANGLPAGGVGDERTYLKLRDLTRNPSAAEIGIQPAPVMPQRLDERCLTGARVICISMKEFRATYVTNGTPVTSWEGRFGSPENPTVPGVHYIHLKEWTTVSTIYGERFPMPYAMFFHADRAVHFSFDFLREGFNGHSHGCMNMRDYGTLKWLYERVQIGDKVVVYDN